MQGISKINFQNASTITSNYDLLKGINKGNLHMFEHTRSKMEIHFIQEILWSLQNLIVFRNFQSF